MIPKPPAPPPSIANVAPAPPPPKAQPAAPPPQMAAKPKQAQPKRRAKPKQVLALQDQGSQHHEDAPDNKRTKTKVGMEDDRDPYGKLTVREIRHLLATNFNFKKTYNSDGKKMNKAELLDELKRLNKYLFN